MSVQAKIKDSSCRKSSCSCDSVITDVTILKNRENKRNSNSQENDNFSKAFQELLKARFDSAISLLEDQFKKDNDNVSTGFLLAQCLRLQHRYEDMIEIYEHLNKKNTLSHLMNYEMAIGYLNTGHKEKALPILEKLSSKVQYEESISYHLAEVYFLEGRLMDAISVLKEALKARPKAKRLQHLLSRLQEVSDP